MPDNERILQLQKEIDELKHRLEMQESKMEEMRQRFGILQQRRVAQQQVMEKRGAWSMENFIGLRLIHFIGIIVLVIGLSIGVKYAIDRNLISESMRIILAYSAGLILYFLSRYLRKNYLFFSTILFSGAMASLYFTTYGAFVYYHIFSLSTAFVIMIALTIYTVYEAIRYDRQEIALLGLVGAYGIPFLISRNAERADLLFLYITFINIAVVFLTVRKQWKNVGRTAQVVTWILFLGWAALRYNSSLQNLGLLFLSFFFLMFMLTVAANKALYKGAFSINDIFQLVLNNVALYIGALLIYQDAPGSLSSAAIITLVISAISILQALLTRFYWKEEALTVRALACVALIFFVVFIALNWSGFAVTILWLVTSIIIFAWGVRMKSITARMAGMLLIGATLVKLLVVDSDRFSTVEKVIAYLILGVLLLVVSFFYQKFRQKIFDARE
jgi:uncharacterized membrane protein